MSDAVVWVMTLLRFVVDEVCAIEDREEGDEQERKVYESLLGGVWSRYLLKMIERVLRTFGTGQSGVELGRCVREQQGKGLSLNGLAQLLDGE